MIDQTNIETWLLMYVDNELSAVEKLQVEEFLSMHPTHQILFDQICKLTLTPEEITFPDRDLLYAQQHELNSLTFEPDRTIQYPFKDQLYQQSSRKHFNWRIPFSIAASVLLILGIFMILDKKEQPIKEVNASLATSSAPASPIQTQVNPAIKIKSNTTVRLIHHVATRKYINPAIYINESTSKEIASTTTPAESIVEVVTVPQTVQSNLSEAAINAASERDMVTKDQQTSDVYINTDLLMEASNRSNERKPLRGLLRNITRRIFKEKTQEPVEGIQISSFVIPVSHKQ